MLKQILIVWVCPQRPSEMNRRVFPITVTSKSVPGQQPPGVGTTVILTRFHWETEHISSCKPARPICFREGSLAPCSALSAPSYKTHKDRKQSTSLLEKHWAIKITHRCYFLTFGGRFFKALLAQDHHYPCQAASERVMNPQTWISLLSQLL